MPCWVCAVNLGTPVFSQRQFFGHLIAFRKAITESWKDSCLNGEERLRLTFCLKLVVVFALCLDKVQKTCLISFFHNGRLASAFLDEGRYLCFANSQEAFSLECEMYSVVI